MHAQPYSAPHKQCWTQYACIHNFPEFQYVKDGGTLIDLAQGIFPKGSTFFMGAQKNCKKITDTKLLFQRLSIQDCSF